MNLHIREAFMHRLIIAFFMFVTCGVAAPAQAENYRFDKEHTTILFFVNHLGFSNKIGRFTEYDGTLTLDEAHPEHSRMDVTLRPAGIRTDSAALDAEIQKEGWFNSEAYPTITFRSTQITPTGKHKAEVSGWMSMLGRERFITLHVTFNKSGEHPITKNHVAGFSADATVNRSRFGMNNSVPLVGEEVRVHIEAEFIRARADAGDSSVSVREPSRRRGNSAMRIRGKTRARSSLP
jgi:polyisoprenoid-binding protein YceI